MKTRTGLAALAMFLFCAACSCDAGSKFTPEDGEETDQEEGVDIDVRPDQGDPDVIPDDGAEEPPPPDGIGDDGDALPDPVEEDGQDVADTTDADTVGECTSPADCAAIYGPAPCGSWECNGGACEVNCPGCTDADRDGYGTGTCAGGDCDDGDDTVFDTAARACYSGPTGTDGVGTCHGGTESCLGGTWGPCTGEVVPSGEACNDEDDDCDGSTDEGLGTITCGVGNCATTVAACTGGVVGSCVPGPATLNDPCGGGDSDCDGAIDEDCATCVPVSPTGNDGTADGTTANPFRTIQAAIDWAAADSTRPRIVCVAAGTACGQTATYAGAVTMANGISVYGNYETGGWTRCTTSTTVIQPGTAEGVLFPAAVASTTVLDGFRVDRHTSTTTAGVTLDGATQAVLSNLVISNTPSVTSSYGVNLINGAAALITASSIFAGNGSAVSIGVRSVGSTPTILRNCQRYDASGRCDEFCNSSGNAIRGRFTTGTGESYAVLLDGSPGAVVQASAMCGNDADTGAGLRIRGDAAGTVVRGNLVNAWGGAVDSHGVWLSDCAAAAPWIVDNFLIASAGDSGTTRVDGVRAVGDCHPVIDSNILIAGGSEGGTSGANGVYCGLGTSGTASQCVVLGNQLIEGSQFGYPPWSVGVRCDDDGCMRIADNVITGRGGVDVWGVMIGRSGTFVDNNAISGGCGTHSTTGVQLEDSFARLQNNRIIGGLCSSGSITTSPAVGLLVLIGAGSNEADVHSNVIDGGGFNGACTSTGIVFDVTASPPAGGMGILRDNIVLAGPCQTANNVVEAAAAADPRIFEANDLDPYGAPLALYVDETSSPLTTAAAIDALADMTVGGTISADAMFVAYPADLHIRTGSPCDGAGTHAGAPAYDMDGQPRSATAPDIGADEI
jgi:hypothetical protein